MMAAGFAILLRSNQVVYHSPLKMGDDLRLTTWVTNVKRSSALRHYLVQQVGEEAPAAEVHSLGVWVDLESGRPIRIPPELLEDFQANISE
jgi:acyl-CoA thioester hydrolase